ncbi:MAG: PTS sugar transporter subunit IIA [Planctomycetota bacterium]|nr:PTS sugar transporter subunit IIA [Planctomycetota bacterium]
MGTQAMANSTRQSPSDDRPLSEMLHPACVRAKLEATTLEAVIAEMVDLLVGIHGIGNRDVLIERYLARERLALSGSSVGRGIAIPHCFIPGVSKVSIALGFAPRGVEWKASSGNPVKSIDGQSVALLGLVYGPDGNAVSLAVIRLMRTLARLPVRQYINVPPSATDLFQETLRCSQALAG